MSSHLRWTSVLIQSLYRSGVRHVVISPGSRSTPLTIAAAIHPGLKKQIVLDERSAAFIAMGIGKATGIPAVLICTSGTAAANYFPALVEAKESGVPIIALTADRPPNLRGIGSSQTINQTRLFGDYSVQFFDTGEPKFEERDLKRLDYLGRQAVQNSIHMGGTVHINMPFRKPLEPEADEINQEKSLVESSFRDYLINPDSKTHTIHLHEEVEGLITKAKRPLIIAGPSNPGHSLHNQLVQCANLLNAPVLSEPGSGVDVFSQSINRYEQFLRNEKNQKKLKPDLILRFGDQPFTKSLLTVLDTWHEVPVVSFSARSAAQDHSMSVSHFVKCHPADEIQWPEVSPAEKNDWINKWKKIDQKARTVLIQSLEQYSSFTDGHIFKSIYDKTKNGWNVMLSNSFIPRDMALFGHSTSRQFVNRGAAGIDGIISTATGIHSASEKATLCITGDLAFLHDSNSLLSVKHSTRPFVIVIVNNGGGTIFRMLPIHNNDNFFRDYFETPQDVEIESIVKAHKINYKKITSVEELNTFDLNSISDTTVVECITNPDESMNLRKTLWNQ